VVNPTHPTSNIPQLFNDTCISPPDWFVVDARFPPQPPLALVSTAPGYSINSPTHVPRITLDRI